MQQDLTGQVLLERYEVQEFLGRGGMAEVYRARDTRRRISVALKFLREDMAEDEVFLRRFRREAAVLETLQHPNIVRYYGFEETEHLHFLVAEYIEGEGLRRKLSQLDRPLTLGQALTILEPVCNALNYAHAEGIYHCDMKPANIMISHTGRVVVADFGIAKLAESATLTYATTGTPAYMAPEQCRGQKVDARTDLYALAITTFEMLTLERPFTGDIAKIEGAVAERIRWEQLKAPPPSPRRYNPEIPVWAEHAILRALEKQRHKRFSTLLAFYDALSHKGKVQPDSALPWATGEAPNVPLAATSATPSKPSAVTRSSKLEQRLVRIGWAARRAAGNTSTRLRRSWDEGSLAFRSRIATFLQHARNSVSRLVRALHSPNVKKNLVYPMGVMLALAVLGTAAWRIAGSHSADNNMPNTRTPSPPATSSSLPAASPMSGTGTPLARVFLAVTAQRANIRSGPATLYPVMATAQTGDKFEVLARSPDGEWYEVCCQQGRSGWMNKDLVEVTGDLTRLPEITPTLPSPQQINGTPTQ